MVLRLSKRVRHSCEDASLICSPVCSSRALALSPSPATPSNAGSGPSRKRIRVHRHSIRRQRTTPVGGGYRVHPSLTKIVSLQESGQAGHRHPCGKLRSLLIITTTPRSCKECPYTPHWSPPCYTWARPLLYGLFVHYHRRRRVTTCPYIWSACFPAGRLCRPPTAMPETNRSRPSHSRNPVVYFVAVDMSIDDPDLACPAQVFRRRTRNSAPRPSMHPYPTELLVASDAWDIETTSWALWVRDRHSRPDQVLPQLEAETSSSSAASAWCRVNCSVIEGTHLA